MLLGGGLIQESHSNLVIELYCSTEINNMELKNMLND